MLPGISSGVVPFFNIASGGKPPTVNLILDFTVGPEDAGFMIELEVYAAGVRLPDKMMGLALELDVLPGLRYKVDTNHDIIYMEFSGDVPVQHDLESIFRKLSLEAKFVGHLPPEFSTKKKTQRIA